MADPDYKAGLSTLARVTVGVEAPAFQLTAVARAVLTGDQNVPENGSARNIAAEHSTVRMIIGSEAPNFLIHEFARSVISADWELIDNGARLKGTNALLSAKIVIAGAPAVEITEPQYKVALSRMPMAQLVSLAPVGATTAMRTVLVNKPGEPTSVSHMTEAVMLNIARHDGSWLTPIHTFSNTSVPYVAQAVARRWAVGTPTQAFSRDISLAQAQLVASHSIVPTPNQTHSKEATRQAVANVLSDSKAYREPAKTSSTLKNTPLALAVLRSLVRQNPAVSMVYAFVHVQKVLSEDVSLKGMPKKPADVMAALQLIASQTSMPAYQSLTSMFAQAHLTLSAHDEPMPISALAVSWTYQHALVAAPAPMPISAEKSAFVYSAALSAASEALPWSYTQTIYAAMKVLSGSGADVLPWSNTAVPAMAQATLIESTFDYEYRSTNNARSHVQQIASADASYLPPDGGVRGATRFHSNSTATLADDPTLDGMLLSQISNRQAALQWYQHWETLPPWAIRDPRATRDVVMFAWTAMQKNRNGYPPPKDMTNIRYGLTQFLKSIAQVAEYPSKDGSQSGAAVKQGVRQVAQVSFYPNKGESQPATVKLVMALVAQTVEYPDKGVQYSSDIVGSIELVAAQVTEYPDKMLGYATVKTGSVAQVTAQTTTYPDKNIQQPALVKQAARVAASVAVYKDRLENQTPAEVAQIARQVARGATYPDKDTRYADYVVGQAARVAVQGTTYPDKGFVWAKAVAGLALRIAMQVRVYPDKDLGYSTAVAKSLAKLTVQSKIYPPKDTAYANGVVKQLLRQVGTKVKMPDKGTAYSDAVVNSAMILYAQPVTEFEDDPFHPPRNKPIITIRYLSL